MRRKKYPEAGKVVAAFYEAVAEAYRNPVSEGEWGSVPGRKRQELLAEEFGISRLKVRKILITTGDLVYPETVQLQELLVQGLKLGEAADKLGMALSTAGSLLPYSKGIYKLSEVSAAAERTALYRERKTVVAKLLAALESGTVDEQKLALWKCICHFSGYPFSTSGRGKRPGVKFRYIVSAAGGSSGKHYAGAEMEGYGNEFWVIGEDGKKREKSISRSSVDYAFDIAREKEGKVAGPKELKIYGSSYVYAMFVRFGVIKQNSGQ